MQTKVTILEEGQVIWVDSRGDLSEQELRATHEAVLKIHRERGLDKVMVDATKQTSVPSTLPVFEFGRDFARDKPDSEEEESNV